MNDLFININSKYYIAGLVSCILSLIILLTKKWHKEYSQDLVFGIQKIHNTNTPRIGGVSVFGGVFSLFDVAMFSLN